MRDHLATLVEDFRRAGNEIAVVRYQGIRRRVATYGQIAITAGRFAALLESHGIGVGDRVLIWGENSAEWVAAFHGCILRGALAVPLDAYGSADFAARIAADVKAKLAVGDALLIQSLAALDFPLVRFEDWPSILPDREAGPVDGLTRDTPLQILFTSGTTGDPKGIVHTHGNVLASIGPIERAAQGYMGYEKYVHPLRFLHTLPLSHVFGQTMGLWVPPIFRAQVHFESRLVAPRIVETIHRERISVLAAVPRVFALIKTHLESADPELAARIAASQAVSAGKLGWKRWWRFRDIHRAFGFKFWALISGGGALSATVEQFWNALGFVLVQGYGMTETTALITLNHPFHVASGTIGKPLPGREVRIGSDGEVLVRGPMISTATWSGGQLRQSQDDWLATGDLAEEQATGELRFLGRKSEVIVTSAGVNIHPEDLEAVIEEQPGVAASAVVAMETPNGPEPCAVLAMRGSEDQAPAAIERANARLADFQSIRRWVLYPEPDLPRTSTGKVRRKAVESWLAGIQAASSGEHPRSEAFSPASDWLLALIAQITGEKPRGVGDELRLGEDLHLDSLGRVQLAAAIEQKLGMPPESSLLDSLETLGQLRAVVSGTAEPATSSQPASPAAGASQVSEQAAQVRSSPDAEVTHPYQPPAPVEPSRRHYVYPHWPWHVPFTWLRNGFVEGVMRPLVWFLADPRVEAPAGLAALVSEPMLIIANHVTAYDGPLIQYALPGVVRRALAAAMSGEMLDDFRRARNPERGPRYGRFFPFGPPAYLLITALFNVFPLPRLRDFQRSFAHAGEALDRGYHVLVFPEGARSAAGSLAPFRPGIGLLVRQAHAAVLPVALCGLGEMKARGRGWIRSGELAVRVGQAIRFAPEATEAEITARLHEEVRTLLEEPKMREK
ncbi:MAG TPA: AMP-binding protein [Terracidiphilus sp.]|jgi:long-chain acyl-CoA synthetase|nr:AMP-binding protein [Terracidiphilus sp.]